MKTSISSQRRYFFLLLLVGVVAILPTPGLVSLAYAEYPILVWFQPGTVQLPQGQTMSACDDASISSGDVSLLLQDFGVDSIGMSVPSFTLGDTLATSYTGETMHQFDWSNVYELIPGAGTDVDSLLASLNQMTSWVIHAEPVAKPVFCAAPTYPSDPYFRDGSQWGAWNYGQVIGGTRDADVDAPEAWGYQTGNDFINIAIIDNGVTSIHPEFTGRMSSQTDPTWESAGT